jgi:hypothetical protein
MAKLSADGITAQSFVNYPKDWYDAFVKGATVQYTKKTGATMVVIDWKPEKGDITGDGVFDNPGSIREWIMVSGLSANGDPLRTDRYMDRLDALGIKRDYTCCGQTNSSRPFVIHKEDGKYYCPHCGNIAKVDIEVNDDGSLPWNGIHARIQVSIEKMDNSDEERNRIQRVVSVQR